MNTDDLIEVVADFLIQEGWIGSSPKARQQATFLLEMLAEAGVVRKSKDQNLPFIGYWAVPDGFARVQPLLPEGEI